MALELDRGAHDELPPAFGVLLINVGSPADPSVGAVRAFLREFLADPRVVEAPRLRWWIVRNLIVLPLRPRRSAALYRSIWTNAGSPLVAATWSLAEKLGHHLRRDLHTAADVAVGMRYGQPSIPAAVSELCGRGCQRMLVLPLYPQYSGTTTGSAIDSVAGALSRRRSIPELRTVAGYAGHTAYIGALAESVREHRDDDAAHLLMSFHGIPTSYAESGDPYPERCGETARLLAESLQLPPDRWTSSYQSRFGRGEWLSPSTEATLTRLGRSGTRGLDVVCPGFAVDCLETLEEIATTGRALYESAGGLGYRYVPALNDTDRHVRALAAIIRDHIGGWEKPISSRGK